MTDRREDLSSKKLAERINQLEALVQTGTLKLDTVARQQSDWDGITSEHLKIVRRELVDAFERIKNIELKLFPHLAADLTDVHKIIGEGEDKAFNPLDRRKP